MLTPRHVIRTIAATLTLACTATTLATLPARAHSQAACKIEALYACQDMQGKHGICVQYAIQLCANHSHAIKNLPLHASQTGPAGPVRRHTLIGPHAQGPRFGLSGPHRGGPAMGPRMGSIGRIAR